MKKPVLMTAKFDSVCPETGKKIFKGDEIVYFPSIRKAFHKDSKNAEGARAMAFAKQWNMADSDW